MAHKTLLLIYPNGWRSFCILTFVGFAICFVYHQQAGERKEGISTLCPGSLVAKQVMRDFIGIEEGDKNAQEAMMNFSYFLTIGNMDEAFKAIKLIKRFVET